MKISGVLVGLMMMIAVPSFAQFSDFENTMGAWYMLFYNKQFGEGPWGLQGDYQDRDFDFEGDFEQILIRNGLTYKLEKADVLLTLGYGNIRTGVFGLENSQTLEHRVYQEALKPWKVSERVSTNHRYRFEQRWVEDQEMKTRHRYNLFVNCALSDETIEVGTVYLALYSEFFVADWELDRTRLYSALGYKYSEEYKVQFGVMRQIVEGVGKNQVQVSIHGVLN